jgi:hypothetical protein
MAGGQVEGWTGTTDGDVGVWLSFSVAGPSIGTALCFYLSTCPPVDRSTRCTTAHTSSGTMISWWPVIS